MRAFVLCVRSYCVVYRGADVTIEATGVPSAVIEGTLMTRDAGTYLSSVVVMRRCKWPRFCACVCMCVCVH